MLGQCLGHAMSAPSVPAACVGERRLKLTGVRACTPCLIYTLLLPQHSPRFKHLAPLCRTTYARSAREAVVLSDLLSMHRGAESQQSCSQATALLRNASAFPQACIQLVNIVLGPPKSALATPTCRTRGHWLLPFPVKFAAGPPSAQLERSWITYRVE